MKLCILIPSYNEEKGIGSLIRALKARNLAVYVVDDGSTDKTASKAESEGAIVIRHEVNKGKGASLREGFGHILKEDFDAVLLMDADGQHAVEDIDSFSEKMRKTDADVVIGNRMDDTSSMPLSRKHTNRFMSWLISKVSGQRVSDTQCGFRLIKTDVLNKIRLESSNYEIESELIIEAARKGFRIESVPIRTVYRDEKSRINPVLDTLRFIFFISKTALRRT